MKLGMVGLGRMGANMVLRLEQDGHQVVTYTRSGRGSVQSLGKPWDGSRRPGSSG